jgi:hypothetical protein
LFALPQRGTPRRFHSWPHDEPDRVDLQALVDLVAAGRLHPASGLVADRREISPRSWPAARAHGVRQ